MENVYWIQTVVVKCIIVALGNALQSVRAQIELLNALIKCEFHKKLIGTLIANTIDGILMTALVIHIFLFFLVDAPDFEALLEYTKILSETTVNLNFFCFDTTVKIHESEAEIEKCVNELVNLEDYANALRLSKVSNLKASKVILAQVFIKHIFRVK